MNYMKSFFRKTFGESPKIKVLDFLLDNRTLDWCKSDIAEQSGISRASLDRFFDQLVKDKVIIKSRTIGRATLYKLNRKLPLVQKLIELDYLLTEKGQSKKEDSIKNI